MKAPHAYPSGPNWGAERPATPQSPPPRYVTEAEITRLVENAVKPSKFSTWVDLACLLVVVVWIVRGCS